MNGQPAASPLASGLNCLRLVSGGGHNDPENLTSAEAAALLAEREDLRGAITTTVTELVTLRARLTPPFRSNVDALITHLRALVGDST